MQKKLTLPASMPVRNIQVHRRSTCIGQLAQLNHPMQFLSRPFRRENNEKQQLLQSLIETCGKSLGRKIIWQSTGGASDGNKFSAVGLPNIDTLGPQGAEIHSENEFLDPSSLVPAAKLTALTLLSMSSNSQKI